MLVARGRGREGQGLIVGDRASVLQDEKSSGDE